MKTGPDEKHVFQIHVKFNINPIFRNKGVFLVGFQKRVVFVCDSFNTAAIANKRKNVHKKYTLSGVPNTRRS